MKITKINSNECGGFKKPKGHLDTQMFPECENWPTDRNIVKKTVEKRKKKKSKEEISMICNGSCSIKTSSNKFNLSKYSSKPQELIDDGPEIRQKWLNTPAKEKVIEYFKEKFPNVSATFEEMLKWYKENFTMGISPEYDWKTHQDRDIKRDH